MDPFDEFVTEVLAGVVTDIIGIQAISQSGWDRGVDFSITTGDQTVIVNAIGDGNWVQTVRKRQAAQADD